MVSPTQIEPRPLLIAVTGTNGKSSVVAFAHQFLSAAGIESAVLGSLGYASGRGRTSAPAVGKGRTALPEFARHVARGGVKVLMLEAYSAALARGLFDLLRVDVAVFTNLGADHLDVHGSMEAYGAAKLRLFTTILTTGGTAVLDSREPGAADVKKALVRRRDVTLVDCADRLPGEVEHIAWPFRELFMHRNARLALAAAAAAGPAFEALSPTCVSLRRPPGRMQRLGLSASGAEVVLDFAHNPPALSAALAHLRRVTRGRIILVFGCGGNRDRHKRSVMGRIASDSADLVVLTDDNPRDEDPAEIRADIRRGCSRPVLEVAGRRRAIHRALGLGAPEDCVLIAGRGVEDLPLLASLDIRGLAS